MFTAKRGMSSEDFAKIYPNATTSTSTYIRGRVNINTASTTVLTALFWGVGYNQGVDQSTAESAAQSVFNYRQQNQQKLTIPWHGLWTPSAPPARSSTALRRGDYITARTYQFSADIAAVGPYGRGYRRVKFIFDTSDGTPKIHLSPGFVQLGWALGDKARQTWVANPAIMNNILKINFGKRKRLTSLLGLARWQPVGRVVLRRQQWLCPCPANFFASGFRSIR